MNNISTVLLYSTIDYRWLNECLESVSKISNEIIVVSCDKLWNGEQENSDLLLKSQQIINSYFNTKWIFVPWIKGYPTFFWETQCRTSGILSTSENTEYILFLDTDEIIDTEKFTDWINTTEYQQYDSMKIANYWYFREKIYRAKTVEDSVVLAKKDLLVKNNSMIIPIISAGREQYHELIECNKKRNILGTDREPMIHHYSWVRTKEEMMQKVKSWGHNQDKNWISMIEEEFSRPFNGKCFVNNYIFDIIE
jgi:hypothetical protein